MHCAYLLAAFSLSDASNIILGLTYRPCAKALCSAEALRSISARAELCYDDIDDEYGVHETEFGTLMTAIVNLSKVHAQQVSMNSERAKG